jgi:peroxiredoxin
MNKFPVLQNLVFLLCVCNFSSAVKAQISDEPRLHCLIKGKVSSLAGGSIEVTASGLMDDTTFRIELDNKGTFELYLHFPCLKTISFHARSSNILVNTRDSDTIELSENKGEIVIKTPDDNRTKAINALIRLNDKWDAGKVQFMQTMLSRREVMKDEDAIKRFTDFYNKQIQDLLSTNPNPKVAGALITEIYYSTLSAIQGFKTGLLPTYGLITIIPTNYKNIKFLTIPNKFRYKELDTSLFHSSATYRSFIFSYCTSGTSSLFTTSPSSLDFNETFEERNYYYTYYLASKAPIRDWILFTMQNILLHERKFKEFHNTFTHFKTNSRNQHYTKYLQAHYNNIKHLQVGSDAADFTLTDIAGKNIALSDFKGRVVYLSFWGVHCGACIYNFKNYYPDIKDKYKDVVFMNVCVEGREGDWKTMVKDLKLDGVNLLVQGSTNHSVSKLYNVYTVPSYFIINKQGKISELIKPALLHQLLKQFPDYNAFKSLD